MNWLLKWLGHGMFCPTPFSILISDAFESLNGNKHLKITQL